MARYWRQDIRGLGAPATPPVEPLGGLQPLDRSRWEAPMRGQDRVAPTSRRIIMQAGIASGGTWRFAALSDTGARPYAYSRARLTSGCFLRGTVAFLPAGSAGIFDNFYGAGALQLDVTWTADDATTETHTVTVSFPVSTRALFAVSTADGAAFGEMRTLDFVIRPPVDLTTALEANRWTVSPTVEILAQQVDAARIVDLAIYEEPVQVCFESDDADWSSHVFGVGDVDSSTGAASARPRTRRSETDPDGNPRGGARQTMDVARAQRERFGPSLIRWTNYQEGTGNLAALQRTGTASGLVGLFDVSQTAWDPDLPGLSVSCGGYAREWRHNNAGLLGTEDAEAVIPVVFGVYGSTSSGTTRVRFQTSEHSWVECLLTTTAGWREAWGHLKVGLNASDPVIGQVFVQGAQTVDVSGFTLEVLPV